jgi:hypothetical protein
VRPLKQEHFINPIVYVEYEHKSGADKILKEGEGHDVEADFLTPNAVARQERIKELELKLILSSTFKGWNFTQNTLAAKDSVRFAVGIWLCAGGESPFGAKGFRETLHVLSAELRRWRRNVRRARRPSSFRPAQYFALRGARTWLEFAFGLDTAHLAWLRAERQ